MLRTSKAFLLGLAAALLALSAFAGSSSAATEFTMSPGGAIEAISLGKLTFEAGGFSIECRVTARGTVRATAIRIAGGKAGEVTAVSINECAGEGSVERVLIETPWEINSRSIEEEVPRGEFTIRGTKFRFSIFGGFARCLYEGNAASIQAMTRIGERRFTNGLATAERASRFRFISGTFGCPSEGTLRGTFTVTTQTITTR